jgi:hypothetical protein
MEKLNVVSKKLGVSKGKIKDMIKDGEISFEVVNGVYYVDIKEIKNKFTITIKTFDMKKEFISDYVIDWEYKFYYTSTLRLSKGGLYPIEINTFNVNQYVFKKFSLDEIDSLTEKLSIVSPIKHKSNFETVIKITQFYSEGVLSCGNDFIPIRDVRDYCIFEYENYIILLHWDLNNGLGVTISDVWKKDNFELIKPFTKSITLSTISKPIYSDSDLSIPSNPIMEHTIGVINYLEERNWDVNSDTKVETTTQSNNRCYPSHTNSLHTVNGYWRNQPYGSRTNPIYKRIWIDTFERGGKKVG